MIHKNIVSIGLLIRDGHHVEIEDKCVMVTATKVVNSTVTIQSNVL